MQTSTMQAPVAPVAFADDPALSKQVKEFLKELNAPGGRPLEEMAPQEARKVLEKAQAAVKVDLSGIEVEEKTIESDGYSIPLHIVRPQGAEAMLPVFMFIHGGGWVLGDFPTHERMVRDLVVLSGATAVFVNYTRSPEAHYPQAINEIYAATKWVAQHGQEIDVDGHRLAIVGNSVGGNMAAVTCLKAREQGGPHILLQVLLWPVTDADFTRSSYTRYGQERFLTTPLMKWMWDQYLPEVQKRKEAHASPLQASVSELQGLPPALIQVAENDILREEGEAYGRKLDVAGVQVKTVLYEGVIHDFGLLNGLALVPATRSLFLHAAAELRHYLF